MFKKPKPDTLARIGRDIRAKATLRSNDLRARLAAKAAEHGPESIYAEMLAGHIARHADQSRRPADET